MSTPNWTGPQTKYHPLLLPLSPTLLSDREPGTSSPETPPKQLLTPDLHPPAGLRPLAKTKSLTSKLSATPSHRPLHNQ